MTEKYPHLEKTPTTEQAWFEALANLARYLRGPDGCPWDRTHSAEAFGKDAVEEAAELVEAFQKNDRDNIEEEFGDTFFVLLATAAAAEEEGLFTLHGALKRAHLKMIRRHDHVFGENKAETAEEALQAWDNVKADEKRSL